MSRQYQNFVQKSFKYIFLLFLSFSVISEEKISIESLFSKIEVVSNSQERKLGLMYRENLPYDNAMFFIWEYKKRQCMWMRNTYIPLNVAYLDSSGKILEIYDMVPLSDESVCSKKRVRYALEVNLNWFEDNNILVGDVLDISNLVKND
ncbi:MAG: DUF192 domain-containing protein [Pseudomonadota bacterium]|jgi:uncharacterized membrane protein (UPF0127 family)|nr:hypothetical protein [Gammaproteobacteria bacterium]MEC8131709.1 DUF192 domain-containing protein [Pseudomonadota bacterium]